MLLKLHCSEVGYKVAISIIFGYPCNTFYVTRPCGYSGALSGPIRFEIQEHIIVITQNHVISVFLFKVYLILTFILVSLKKE